MSVGKAIELRRILQEIASHSAVELVWEVEEEVDLNNSCSDTATEMGNEVHQVVPRSPEKEVCLVRPVVYDSDYVLGSSVMGELVRE